MQRRSCAERHPVLASVGVPILAAMVAYWWSAAAVVVVAAAVCMCVMLHRWWRFEVAAHCKQAALLNAAARTEPDGGSDDYGPPLWQPGVETMRFQIRHPRISLGDNRSGRVACRTRTRLRAAKSYPT